MHVKKVRMLMLNELPANPGIEVGSDKSLAE